MVLDVRDREEWDSGHIPDALWIPTDEVDAHRGELPRDRSCRSGNVATELREQGYEVQSIEGGMEAWEEADLPMEPSDASVVQP